MSVDWSMVGIEHIRQACEQFDQGIALPSRPARSTFLLLNGKSYPAKFIRGLAYRIATGIDLDPSKEFSGGDETARFFVGLGLEISKDDAAVAASPIPPVTPIEKKATEPGVAEPVVERKYEPQKQALFDLLTRRFGTVETETKFPWLIVPKQDELSEPHRSIFTALEAMRGHSTFAVAGQSLRCDFFIPQERLIVEYDERQHFTLQRATALELYPNDLFLGFDRQEWITACKAIRASDPAPPHRDEQRAFYDSLRDVLAAANGYRLIRFRQGNIDWTGSDAESHWTSASSGLGRATAPKSNSSGLPNGIRKIALVSHDCYNVPDSRGLLDYSEHFDRINKLCDQHSCDTILYALWTWDSSSSSVRTHDSIFQGLDHVQTVILEVFDPPEQPTHIEIWRRGLQTPMIAVQNFAQSQVSAKVRRAFVNNLKERQVGSALLVICGESGIVSENRSGGFFDGFGFVDALGTLDVRVILNPIHDFMGVSHGIDIRNKRRLYSEKNRTMLSVWNQGKKTESQLPWTVFHDGEELTDQVRELDQPFSERPDIRVGLFEMP